MGETQVAEGPLIQHVPGGYAEWRAKESGLPPARFRSSEGEWWGKLVDPPPIKEPVKPEPIIKPDDTDVSTDTLPNWSDYSLGEKLYLKHPDMIDWSQPHIPGYTEAINALSAPTEYGWGDLPYWQKEDDPTVREQWLGFRHTPQPVKPKPPKTLTPAEQGEWLDDPSVLEQWLGYRPVGETQPPDKYKGQQPFGPYKQ